MPVISKITGAPFRFWCQKILPAVYDDSLSYYELLCKVVDYLNKVMEDDINVVNLVNELEEFVNNYFDNLDVQQEINNKLDAMAEDGSLLAVVAPHLDEIIGQYEATLDEDLAEYKATMDADVADFKSTVNDAIGAQDTDIANFKSTVSGQVSAQNTEIANFKTNVNTTVSEQDNDISVMQSQMDNFIQSHSEVLTFTELYSTTEALGAHYVNETFNLSDDYTQYPELDIYWSYNSVQRCTRVKTSDVIATGVEISFYADEAVTTTNVAPMFFPFMKIVNGNTAHTQLKIDSAYSERWSGASADSATRNIASSAADYSAGSIIKVVGVSYQDSAELQDIRVGYDGTVYPTAGDAVRDQITDLKSALTDTQDWLGYPKNLFDYQFVTTHTSNWTISQTGNDVTITHLTQWGTGYPRTEALELEEGTYHFSANYNGGTNLLALYKDSNTFVKTLTGDDEITIESGNTYYIRIGTEPAQGTSITISDMSITQTDISDGKIPEIEADISALQVSESVTAQTVEVLQSGFNSIAQPILVELTGEETLNKAINPSGTLITGGDDDYRVCKYAVAVGKKYWITATTNWSNLLWCFYASDDSVVQTGTQAASGSVYTTVTDTEVTAPVNSAYIIIAYKTTITQGALKTQTGYKTAKWIGKKWVCVGDSLTAENIRTTKHYFDYVAEETGITTVNMGVSGSGYARMADTNQAFYQRISACPTDADVVTIFGSFNDLGAGLPIGSVDDTGTTTIAGCINTTITNLQNIIPLVNLGIVAPTPWDTTQPSTSGQAYNYIELLKSICERRSIPFLDLWRCSNLRPWDADFRTLAYSKDGGSGTHPDENGHKLIAPRFEGFLDTLLL